jgi:hypothetical protein
MAKKKTVSKGEMEAKYLQDALENARSRFTNEPTIQYEIGQEVNYGAIDKTVILESLDGGKIYKVHLFSSSKHSRDSGTDRIDYVCWHDLTPIPNKDAEILCSSDRPFNFSQVDTGSLLYYYYFCGIDMNPPYQRGNVWGMENKQALIHSIFENADIGKFVLLSLPYKQGKFPQYEVLDGKQRINALVEFTENRFAYKGKRFFELHCRDQNHLLGYSVAFCRVDQLLTLEQKCRYFLRLNLGGVPQDPKHIAYVQELLKKEQNS